MSILNRQVSSSTDDAIKVNVTVSVNSVNHRFGNNTRGIVMLYYCAQRFNNITIPQGATIVSAHMELYGNCSLYTARPSHYIRGKIIGIDEDDTATFCFLASCNPWLRSLTTAQVDWDILEPSGPPISGWHTSPDISSVIQEIINRGGWSSGNDLGVIVDDDEKTGSDIGYYFAGKSYDYNPVYAPKLTINYVIWQPRPCGIGKLQVC